MEAVEIAIYKEGDANTVAVAREIERRLERVNAMLPGDLELVKVYDQSLFITQAVNEVIHAGLVGGLLAVIILYFFLRNFWTTIIISMSIPVSVIVTFNLMFGADLTLNIMSLGGIALGIGMLLDLAIEGRPISGADDRLDSLGENVFGLYGVLRHRGTILSS